MKKLFLFLLAALGVFAIIFMLPVSASGASLAGIGGLALVKSNSQLNKYAQEYSSFNGEENFECYTGFNDDFLEFSGNANSFMNSLQNKRIFTMTIVNNLATAEHVTLIPDYTWAPRLTGTKTDSAGNTSNIVVDGSIKTVSTASLTGAGSPTPIVDFLSYIAKRPTQCWNIRLAVAAADVEQLEQQIIVGGMNPFGSSGFEPISINEYVKPEYTAQRIANVPTPGLILGDEIQLSMNILAGVTVTVSFYCGVALSANAALKNKMAKAQNTISVINASSAKQIS